MSVSTWYVNWIHCALRLFLFFFLPYCKGTTRAEIEWVREREGGRERNEEEEEERIWKKPQQRIMQRKRHTIHWSILRYSNAYRSRLQQLTLRTTFFPFQLGSILFLIFFFSFVYFILPVFFSLDQVNCYILFYYMDFHPPLPRTSFKMNRHGFISLFINI